MSYGITCPYCFEEFNDNEVHFRSDRISRNEENPLPDEYDDLDDFLNRYADNGKKEEIRKRYQEWSFFLPNKDQRYEEFWSHFGGTTEENPDDQRRGVSPAYLRRVIDPTSQAHQQYLRKQASGEWYGRDPGTGMVTYVELKTGEKSNRRVCPYCHNPLPAGYGLYEQKFVTTIGITGAGKTVYLSQLLSKLGTYAATVGLKALVINTNTKTFISKNRIAKGKRLPPSTPANRLQQPLFYDMVRDIGGGKNETRTFVLYDVAGEVFETAEDVMSFAPFVAHSHGLILLIDPMQFQTISQRVESEGEAKGDPDIVLDTIHSIVCHGNKDEKCKVPLAVCISKVDQGPVQEVLEPLPELRARLLDDYNGVHKTGNGLYAPIFNAHEYNLIVRDLDVWVQESDIALANALESLYADYSYFAFTALGCGVESREDDNGVVEDVPEGPIAPKRIEEPILWMFHRLGYIAANERLYNPAGELVQCPNCGSEDTVELPSESYVEEGRFFFKRKIPVNRECPNCGYKFLHEEEMN